MTFLRRAVAALGAALLLAIPTPAFAQAAPAVSLDSPDALPRTDANGNAVEKRLGALTPEGVSLTDCLADQRIVLSVTTTIVGAGHLEAWAAPVGTDCSAEDARHGAATTCTALLTGQPLASTASLAVPVRAIVAAAKLGAPLDASVCGTVDDTNVSVQVLYLDDSDNALAEAAVSIAVDTVGDPAPTTAVASLAGTVHVEVTPNAATTTGRFAVYCAAADAVDPNAATNACTGSAIAYLSGVPDSNFDAAYRCVSIVQTMAPYETYVKATADGTAIAQGTNVAVRVADIDAFGNIGTLSAAQCAIEEEVADVDDPTKCSSSPGPARSPGSAAFVIALCFALAMVRAQRARRV